MTLRALFANARDQDTMRAIGRRSGTATLILLAVACGNPAVTSPGNIDQPPSAPTPTPTPPPPTPLPPLSGPLRAYTFDHALLPSPQPYTNQSRFVLHDNGTFALQYLSLNLEYRGRYTESGGRVQFDWEGWSTAGSWGATGTIEGDRLTVRYNVVMAMSDFEDAVYRLVP